MRPAFTKMLFHVQRPGENVRGDWELFFHVCNFSFFSILFSLFSCQKKTEKKQFCGRPTGHNFSHPLDRKHIFLKGGLRWERVVWSGRGRWVLGDY